MCCCLPFVVCSRGSFFPCKSELYKLATSLSSIEVFNGSRRVLSMNTMSNVWVHLLRVVSLGNVSSSASRFVSNEAASMAVERGVVANGSSVHSDNVMNCFSLSVAVVSYVVSPGRR
ncbi:hypothetical protein Ancab_021990 [Ancistrocladus abbreviatus]